MAKVKKKIARRAPKKATAAKPKAYVLKAAPAHFSITGHPTAPVTGYKLPAAPGSFSMQGESVAPEGPVTRRKHKHGFAEKPGRFEWVQRAIRIYYDGDPPEHIPNVSQLARELDARRGGKGAPITRWTVQRALDEMRRR